MDRHAEDRSEEKEHHGVDDRRLDEPLRPEEDGRRACAEEEGEDDDRQPLLDGLVVLVGEVAEWSDHAPHLERDAESDAEEENGGSVANHKYLLVGPTYTIY